MKKFIILILVCLVITGCNKTDKVDKAYLDAIDELGNNKSFSNNLDDLNFKVYYIKDDQSFRLILDEPRVLLKDLKVVAYAINDGKKISTVPQVGYYNQVVNLGVKPKGVILTGYLDKQTDFDLVVRIEYIIDDKSVVKFLKVGTIDLI